MRKLSAALGAVAALWLILAPALATAACQGKDLLAQMSPEEKAALVGDVPYASGNLWRATRGDATITLIGTYHMPDPRFDAMMPQLASLVRSADALLVEAGPKEEAALLAEVKTHPERIFVTNGPTLPERLDEASWQALTKKLRARGFPPFLAAKLRPDYVAMLFATPTCLLDTMKAAPKGGLDKQLIAVAQQAEVPIRALEPYDTVFAALDAVPGSVQLDMLRSAIAMDARGGDMVVTLGNAYFAGEHQMILAFTRSVGTTLSGLPAQRGRRISAEFDRHLLLDRSRSWIPVLERAAQGHHIVAAFGAGHLGGRGGVLELLHEAGFTLTRLPL